MSVIIDDPKNKGIIIDELSAGEVVVSATETVYGFLAKTIFQDAYKKIYKLKKRDIEKPLAVLIGTKEEFYRFGKIAKLKQKGYAKKLDAGDTIIIKIAEQFKPLFNNMEKVGFRIPQCELQKVLVAVGPCWGTSVNVSGEAELNDAQKIDERFGEEIGFIYNCIEPSGKPSRVIDATGLTSKVVRK